MRAGVAGGADAAATTAARANRFGRNELPIDLRIDILEVIFELLEPRDLTHCSAPASRGMECVLDMHSWLRKKFIELDKRVHAWFAASAEAIMQTLDGPVWPHNCSCQPRNTIEPRYDGHGPSARLIAALGSGCDDTAARAVLEDHRILVKAATGRQYNTFRGLSLGRESALSCITVGDVLRLYDGRRWGRV